MLSEEAGHGTHVAGTLAGAQSGSSAGDSDADGGAFQAKLAVFDFGDSDNNNALSTPNEVTCRRPFGGLATYKICGGHST